MYARMTCGLILTWLLLAVPVASQTRPAPSTSAKGNTPAVAPSPAEDRAPYDPSGRRDPFVSLRARGEANLPSGDRPRGVRGVLINDVSLRGVLRNGDSLLGIVHTPDNKTYTVRAGDVFFDGSVKAVTTDAVIFLQRVDDPLSPVKQREVRKALRTPEENR